MFKLTHRDIEVTVRRYTDRATDQKVATTTVFFLLGTDIKWKARAYTRYVRLSSLPPEKSTTKYLAEYAITEALLLRTDPFFLGEERTKEIRLSLASALYELERRHELRYKVRMSSDRWDEISNLYQFAMSGYLKKMPEL